MQSEIENRVEEQKHFHKMEALPLWGLWLHNMGLLECFQKRRVALCSDNSWGPEPRHAQGRTHTHTHTVSRDQLRVTHWHNQSVDIASIDSPQKTPSVDLLLMCHTCFCLSILLHSSVSLFLLSASSLTFKSISIFFLRFHPVLLSLSLSPPSFFSFLSPFEENTTNNQTPLTPSPQEFSDPSP